MLFSTSSLKRKIEKDIILLYISLSAPRAHITSYLTRGPCELGNVNVNETVTVWEGGFPEYTPNVLGVDGQAVKNYSQKNILMSVVNRYVRQKFRSES